MQLLSSLINIPLIVDPPSWKTWWIYSICIIVIGIFIYYVIRKRISDAAVDQRILREKVREKTRELESEKGRAEYSEKVKEQFLANMSHEIRTPMNAILGMTRLLLEKEPRTDQLKYLNSIKHASDNLLVIINDILDLSKIEAGKINLESIPFDIRNEIKSVFETMKVNADDKNLELKTDIENTIPKTIIGDPYRLSQILLNLTGNAIKFTEKGSVTIKTTAAMQGEKVLLTFSVIDTGIGIAKDKLDYIFDMFTQETSSTTRKFGGTGLGLAICKKLIELQGGAISVDSEAGKGSVFSFTLPFAIGKDVVDENPKAEHKQQVVAKMKNLRILLAEDNEFNQMVAVDTLESAIEGAQVTVAANGKIAVDMLKNNTFDIVLMDIQMPEMDGHEATKTIGSSSDPRINSMPIIAMTASVIKAEVDKCFESGMNEFVGKPFSVDELLEKMSKIIVRS
ncbi:MAG: response regulator [Bacteroidetes bacterium]|nr:response regulator [Bacteroidota bacterium]